jgi:hypothetical protein
LVNKNQLGLTAAHGITPLNKAWKSITLISKNLGVCEKALTVLALLSVQHL